MKCFLSNLQKMVLHDVSDDAKLVKVSTPAHSAKGLFEGDDDGGNVVPVPSGAEQDVTETEGDQVLHHLLAKVVVDTVDLLLLEQRRQMVGQLG